MEADRGSRFNLSPLNKKWTISILHIWPSDNYLPIVLWKSTILFTSTFSNSSDSDQRASSELFVEKVIMDSLQRATRLKGFLLIENSTSCKARRQGERSYYLLLSCKICFNMSMVNSIILLQIELTVLLPERFVKWVLHLHWTVNVVIMESLGSYLNHHLSFV